MIEGVDVAIASARGTPDRVIAPRIEEEACGFRGEEERGDNGEFPDDRAEDRADLAAGHRDEQDEHGEPAEEEELVVSGCAPDVEHERTELVDFDIHLGDLVREHRGRGG